MRGTRYGAVCEKMELEVQSSDQFLGVSKFTLQKSNQAKEGLYEPRVFRSGEGHCSYSECSIKMDDNSMNYHVISTNYEGYLIIYSCDTDSLSEYQKNHPDLDVPENGFLWAFTREENIHPQALKELGFIINDEFNYKYNVEKWRDGDRTI